MGDLVSQREFARRNNWNPGYVAKLKARGTLVMVDEKVDVDASMISINEARDPAKAYMVGVNAQQRARHKQDMATAPNDADREQGDEVHSPLPASSNSTFNRARTAREVFDARIAELNYKKRIGALVSLDDMQEASSRRYKLLQNKLSHLADRIAPMMPEQCRAQVWSILDKEVKRCLHELSEDAAAQLSAGTGERLAG